MTQNLLLEQGLPESIDGIPIYPDFRNMIRFEQILQDAGLSNAEKVRLGLIQLYASIPDDVEHALDGLMWMCATPAAVAAE